MRKVAIPLAILALIGLDQWVKHWVVANIALNQVIKAIPGLFSLTYLQNRGAAFSILQDQKYFFVILTVLVIGAALVYLVKNYQKSLWLVLSLVLIISGGIGNFIDRVHLGYVVDMVQLDFIGRFLPNGGRAALDFNLMERGKWKSSLKRRETVWTRPWQI